MKTALTIALVAVLAGGAFYAGTRFANSPLNTDSATGRRILHYVDPMNPAHTSDKPGLAPCGMKMQPVYADEAGAEAPGRLLPGAVRLSQEKQQLIGVVVGASERKSVRHTMRLLGRVVTDDTRSYRVTAPSEGWITKAMPRVVGTYVRRDETLAMLYSPSFISAGQAFRTALDYQDRMETNQVERSIQRPGLAQFNVKQWRDSLRNLGVSDRQIDEMIRTRQYSEVIEIVAPADGYLTSRTVSHGERFEKGAELYRVTDLTRVWIQADVFERDSPLILPGVETQVRIPGRPETYPARLSDSLPQFDPVSRTLKLRFEADNPQFVFKPEMFVDLEFTMSLPEALVVPAEAVVDSGQRQAVYVERGSGWYEPRTVQTGWRVGDQVQILQGLMPGERIVVSGNFLLDSESRMKLAASGVHGVPQMDPVCGMTVDAASARTERCVFEDQGKTWFFCNPECKEQFARNPAKFRSPPSAQDKATPAAVPGKSIDPVCGMSVTEDKARLSNRTSTYQGRAYFFCADSCKAEFDENPGKFVTTASTNAPAKVTAAP
jgi:YHS domain-containing protein/multidrug efflux pump subunit AcrA (membrane-fusion protein)